MIDWKLTMGLLAALTVGAGCGNEGDYKTSGQVSQEKGAAPAEDAHHHDHAKGPHGGAIIELGEEEHHAELVVDHDLHLVQLFLLGPDAKTPSLTKATEVKLALGALGDHVLKAAPLEGEADGNTSRFQLDNEDVVHKLLDAPEVEGSLEVTVGEKPFVGKVHAHFNEEHDHDHDHGAEAKK